MAARVNLGANYRLASLDADLSFTVTYTKNDSNLPLYEYDRTQVSVSLGKMF